MSVGSERNMLGARTKNCRSKSINAQPGDYGERHGGGIIISAGGKFNKDFLTTLNQHTMGIVCKH